MERVTERTAGDRPAMPSDQSSSAGRSSDAARQRLFHLALLRAALLLVAQILEPASAASPEMRAGSFDPERRGPLERLEARLGPAATRAGDARVQPVAGQAAVHEHHLVVV